MQSRFCSSRNRLLMKAILFIVTCLPAITAGRCFTFIPATNPNLFRQSVTRIVSAVPRVWIEEAEDGFVDNEENLEEGEILLEAVKAFASTDSFNEVDADNNPDGGNVGKKFLCAGALVQRPSSSGGTICDAWMADSIMNGDGGPNLQIQGATTILDALFHYYLSLTNKHDEKGCAFVVQCGRESSEYTCASYRAAISRGFRPVEEFSDTNHIDEDIIDGLMFDDAVGIERYTNLAWYSRGTAQGNTALEMLRYLSSRRIAFDYERDFSADYLGLAQVSKLHRILPQSVVVNVNRRLQEIQEAGLLESELDSVDGLPSQHISLVSRGDRVVTMGTAPASILSLIENYVYGVLLPKVKNTTNLTNIKVMDIFLRKYGGKEQSSMNVRHDLAGHYDVYNIATAVIALDESSAQGTQGLYTFSPCVDGAISSHAAHKRYFPLSSGDAVLHSWRVKHGVKIDLGEQRTSLVVWFGVENENTTLKDRSSCTSTGTSRSLSLPPSPIWLSNAIEAANDDIARYVLASAMESLPYCCGEDISHDEIQQWSCQERGPYELLIQSAMSGNSDSLTRLGTLCGDGDLSLAFRKDIVKMLDKLRPAGGYGKIDLDPLEAYNDEDEGDDKCRLLCRKLWFEAAMRGNALAQVLLGDEAINENDTPSPEKVVVASTLYALAAQQGDFSGIMSLLETANMKGEAAEDVSAIVDAALALASGKSTRQQGGKLNESRYF